jgi:hypothetical protein
MCGRTRLASHGIVRVVGAKAFIVMVPEATVAAVRVPGLYAFTGMLRIIFLSYLLFDPHHQTSGPRAPSSLAVLVAQG